MPYTSNDINQFIDSRGIADNPWAMYSYAKQYNVDPSQIDTARGWDSGTSANWIKQQGLAPLGQQPTQPQQMPPWGNYQQNPGGSSTVPMASPQRQQPTAQNPYLQGQIDNLTNTVTTNLNRNILPSIRRGQVANGTLGSTRQGIAEGIAVGDTNNALSGAVSNLQANQFNADRNYGLQSDALDQSIWQGNQNAQRQSALDQLGMYGTMLGLNQQYGVNNSTQVQNTPLNYWQTFGNQAAQFAGLGGANSQQLQGNQLLGGLGGALTAYNMWNGWNNQKNGG